MKKDSLHQGDSISAEAEQRPKAGETNEGEFDPEIKVLLDQASELVHSQIDPMMREALRDKPEALAEWEEIMRELKETEDQQVPDPARRSDVFMAPQFPGRLMSLDEIRETFAMMNARLDRFADRQPPDLEVDEELERSFREMHNVDKAMREQCRDSPENLLKWEEAMEYLQELEERYRRGLEFENSQPVQ